MCYSPLHTSPSATSASPRLAFAQLIAAAAAAAAAATRAVIAWAELMCLFLSIHIPLVAQFDTLTSRI
jgi:hypothetical protein